MADLSASRRLMVPCALDHLGTDAPLRMFSTVTTLSGPQDITLQDLHIEAFFSRRCREADQRLYGR